MEISSVQGQMSYQNVGSSMEDNSVTNKTETQTQQEVIKEEIDTTKKQEMRTELKSLTEKLNKEMNPLNTSIKFGFDDSVEEMFVNVMDTKTEKIIRKIPSDEALELMAKMREIVGMLFDTKG
jgi:flagellar protein FlaG